MELVKDKFTKIYHVKMAAKEEKNKNEKLFSQQVLITQNLGTNMTGINNKNRNFINWTNSKKILI